MAPVLRLLLSGQKAVPVEQEMPLLPAEIKHPALAPQNIQVETAAMGKGTPVPAAVAQRDRMVLVGRRAQMPSPTQMRAAPAGAATAITALLAGRPPALP